MTLDEIRFEAEEASINASHWYDMMEKVEQMLDDIDKLPADKRNEQIVALTDSISVDMMMSFIFSMSCVKHPVVDSVRAKLNVVDKKWTGPEDEIISGGLIEMARYDIVNDIENISLEELCSLALGLTEYFGQSGMDLSIGDVFDYPRQLHRHLTTGEAMNSNEHEFHASLNDYSELKRMYPDTNLTNLVVTIIFDYFGREYPNIHQSGYDHTDDGQRLFAINKIMHELTYEIYTRLVGVNPPYALRATCPEHPDMAEYYAMRPVLDVGLRIVLYSHILNCDRMVKMKTIPLIYDTLSIRRVLDNEYYYWTNVNTMQGVEGEIYKRNQLHDKSTRRGELCTKRNTYIKSYIW